MLEDMKITVCFGATKIIVPCGSELPVRELVKQAIVRYRKVTNKHADDYICVHCLQTCDEGAILDEDDTVGDVLDDRDKVIASFDESLITRPGHNGGDGTSTSSVGTASPDIFQADTRGPIEGIPVAEHQYSSLRQQQRIIDDYKLKNALQVKYVENFSPHSSHSTLTSGDNHEETRENGARLLEGRSSGSDIEGCEGVEHGVDDRDENDSSAFKREPARKSLKSDHLDRWIDMQESYSEFRRHEPTGAPPSPVEKFNVPDSSSRVSRQISLALSEPEDSEHLNIVLKPTMGENLGITIQGYKTADESELGLIVFEIDPKGCAARDGRVQVADRIVAVNNQDLTHVSNERAEEAFSKALQCDTIELSISRSHSFLPAENQSNREKLINGTSSHDDVNVDGITDEDKNTVPPLPNFSSPAYKKTLTTQDKTDVAIPRIVEKKIVIELQKGSDGLGFSVTSRDNPAGGACPIYVKNILPHGAAIRDGRLQAGDQILEVDGTEMTGKSQEQAVNILRSIKGQVRLLIERRVTVTSPIGSKKLIKDIERAPSDSRGNKILTYQIPLPISGTAGLGITVKGKSNVSEQNESSGDDLGIFVKTVVPGGAAHQDGRLRPDDQLISVNGVKLTGMSNSSAMKTLRSAMETKTFGPVEVTVIRSVKDIMDNVSELETIRQRKNTSDRAIDVGGGNGGGNGSGRTDFPDGALGDIQEIESAPSLAIQNQQGIKTNDEDTRSKPEDFKPSYYNIPPASDGELRRRNEENEFSHDSQHQSTAQRRTVLDEEMKHRSTNSREQNDEMKKLFAKPVLNERNVVNNRVLTASNHVTSNMNVKDETERTTLDTKTPAEDKVGELKPSRGRAAKLGNGVHRNPSYYIAMNRTGQRVPKSKKPKSPFYQPKEESRNKKKESHVPPAIKEEKPKIVIASITDTARVWNTTRPNMSITNRPSSTVAESTSALSTSSSATLPRSSDQSRAGLSPPRPPMSINIPKGTPPPPPPRTQRPSPYAKQFPNYLLAATTQSSRKLDNTFLDYTDNSDVPSAFQKPRESSTRESSAKVVSAEEVKSESKKNEKPNVSAQNSNDSKVDDVIDYLTDDDEEGIGENFVREGLGRQSMSEKRFKLAQADITQTQFYKERVTRSRSLEGTQDNCVNQQLGTYETKTLPRPNTTPIDQSRRLKSEKECNERLIDFSAPSPKERSNKPSKESLSLGTFDPNNVRGQWRTSSDGVVKKYGRHGNYIKTSPLASMANNNFESVATDVSQNGGDDAVPITMQSNADYSSVHPKVKKKSSGFNLKNLGAALKSKAYKGKYDMQTPESPSEPAVDMDEQRYRQLLGKPRERSLSETLHTRHNVDCSPESSRSRRKKQEQQKRPSPTSLQDILKKGSGEYSITESAQI